MLTVYDYGQIRRAHRDGMSLRAIARTLHHSRRKVREALGCPEPQGYLRTKDPPAPRLGPFKPIIYDLQRRFATPVPRVADLAELNAWLRACCLKERERVVAGQTETIGQRFEHDRSAAQPLPAYRFDPCLHQAVCVDKYQTVRFDGNRYSVPRPCAFRAVTIKGYVDRLEVVADGTVVARHERCYQRDQQVLDPLHYLATLGRRPAALDHSRVYRDWRLPAEFTHLRQALEQRHGASAGARQYIRVLQLLAQHPVPRVQRAIQSVVADSSQNVLGADRIIQHTFRLAQRDVAEATPWAAVDHQDPVRAVQVGMPDLSQFDQLLSLGERLYV